jgi:glycosyltransferase involved in cell wall biosynthesis
MSLIALDARSIRKIETGLGRVAKNMIRSLAQIDVDHEYLLIQRSEMETPVVSDPRFRPVYVPYDIASLQNTIFFSDILKQNRPTVYHSLYSFFPLNIPDQVKTIVTIHDFNWIQRPSLAASAAWKGVVNYCYGSPMHAHATRIADHIVCITGQTRDDLLHLFPETRAPVTVIHHGVDAVGLSTGEVRPEIKQYQGKRFMLCVGNGRPYKNPEGTLDAFAKLKKDSSTQDIKLIMVGRGDRKSHMKSRARKAGVEGDLDFVGMVSDAELAFLMQQALLLSFPSFWEGFGLPVIEAFAFGCPVIATDMGALKEISGHAALMIKDPHDIDEISRAMHTIIHEPSTRERLRQAGLERAAAFSWDKAAQAYLDIYIQLLKDKTPG